MMELTLRRLVTLKVNGQNIYEIEEDRLQGHSLDELDEQIRFIIQLDKRVLGIETVCLVNEPVVRKIMVNESLAA